jgi:hypothetical protein
MRKIAFGIVSALVGGAMLVSGAGAASASTQTHTQLRIRDITPNPVVVKAGAETTAYFDIGASRDVEKVELSVAPARVHTLRAKSVKDLEGWRFAIGFNENDPAGKWRATAVAFDEDGKVIARDSAYFAVEIQKKSDTRVSRFFASPSKVRKGKSIFISGRLQAKDDDRWKGVRGERVNVYYRASGHSAWKWVDSAKTRWDGKFYAKTRAYKSGWFRAVYSGDDNLQSTKSRSDYVRVYSHWWRH